MASGKIYCPPGRLFIITSSLISTISVYANAVNVNISHILDRNSHTKGYHMHNDAVAAATGWWWRADDDMAFGILYRMNDDEHVMGMRLANKFICSICSTHGVVICVLCGIEHRAHRASNTVHSELYTWTMLNVWWAHWTLPVHHSESTIFVLPKNIKFVCVDYDCISGQLFFSLKVVNDNEFSSDSENQESILNLYNRNRSICIRSWRKMSHEETETAFRVREHIHFNRMPICMHTLFGCLSTGELLHSVWRLPYVLIDFGRYAATDIKLCLSNIWSIGSQPWFKYKLSVPCPSRAPISRWVNTQTHTHILTCHARAY